MPVNKLLFLSSFPFGFGLTFGTAAWKLSPVTACPPDTWNRARIITTPGFAGDVCGVSVIFSSFLSYAVYGVNRCCCGAAAGLGGGVADAVGANVGEAAYAAGIEEGCGVGTPGAEMLAFVLPNRPMMSSTVDRACCAGGEEVVVASEELPKISASRSWLDWADGAGWLGFDVPGVDTISSPRRSPWKNTNKFYILSKKKI